METIKILLLIPLFFTACKSDPGQTANNSGANAAATAQNTSSKQELMFVLSDQTVSKGDTVCVEVTVRDFTNILSMQYSMNWDPKVLSFLRVDGFKLKDLSVNNFGLNRTDQGKMGTSWFDYAVQGISIPDGSAIYRVCFIATGDPGASSQVIFSSEPVIIEVSNSAEQLLSLAFKRANITIQ